MMLYKILPDNQKNTINQEISEKNRNIFNHEPFKPLIEFYKNKLKEISPTLDELNIDQLVASLKFTILNAFEKNEEFNFLTRKKEPLTEPSAPFLEKTLLPQKESNIKATSVNPQPIKPERTNEQKTGEAPKNKSYLKRFWEMLASYAVWFRSSKNK